RRRWGQKSTSTPSRDEIESWTSHTGHFMTSDPIGWPQVRRGRVGVGSRQHDPLEPPVFLVPRPSDAELSQIPASVNDAPFTYDEVASTARPDELPEGYHQVHAARVLGAGAAAFAAAVDGVRRWQLHRRQGYRVAPDYPPVEVGTVVAVDVP